MKSIICQLLAISVLFMSTEGLWDMANETHPHGDIYAHQIDADHSEISGVDPLTEDCADHCTNYCHGHFSVIPGNDESISLNVDAKYRILASTYFSASPQAPPTPPPNV
jgi:hypothetical protein